MAGELSLVETLDNGQFINALGQSEAKYNQHVKSVKQGADDMDASLKKAGAMIGTYFGAQMLAGFAKEIVNITGEFQQLDVAFTTMLGSKQSATELMTQLVSTAAKTPFTLQEVASGAKQLLAYQVAQEDVNDTLIRLGNISAGLGTPLSRLILVYGQVMAKGKLMGDDLRQFTEAGVPMIHEIAKQMGIADKEVANLVSDGKIGFKEVEQVLKNLTNEGGMFFNLMESQSKTVTGKISNLQDEFTVMLNEIGSANTGVINDALAGAAYVVENYETIGKTILYLVSVYGAYKVALMTVAAAQGIVNASSAATLYLELNKAIGAITIAHRANAVAIGIETAAQSALNAVMAINPYVLVVTAIAAVVGAVWLLHDGTTAQTKAQERLNKVMQDAKQIKDDLKSETTSLLAVINSETEETINKVEAYERLQRLYPGVLANMNIHAFLALAAADKQRMLNKEINNIDTANIDKLIAETQSKIESLKESLSHVKSQLGAESTQKNIDSEKIILSELKEQKAARDEQIEQAKVLEMTEKERINYYRQQVKELESQKSSIDGLSTKTGTLTGFVDKLNEKLGVTKKQNPFNLMGFGVDALNSKIDELNNKIAELQGGGKQTKDKGTKSFWETEKKNAEDALSGMTVGDKGSDKWNNELAKLREAEKNLKAWDFKQSNKRVTPFGTLEYYDELIKKLKDSVSAFDSISGRYTNKKGVDITKEIEGAEAKRRELTFRSADEEIAKKKEQYQAYYSMIAAFGKDVADKQFAELLQSGDSYTKYLENQKSKLKTDIDKGVATDSGVETYNKITEELDKINLVKSSWDEFTETMSRLKSESKTTSEYIEKLNKYKDGISGGGAGKNMTPEQRKTAVATIGQTTTKATSDELNQLLEKYRTYNQQIVDIEAKKNEDIAILDAARATSGDVIIDNAIKLRREQAQKETAAVGDAILQETALYKDLFGDISNMGVKALLELQRKGESYISGAKKQTGTDGAVSYKMPEIVDVNGQKTQQVISEAEYKAYIEKIRAIGGQVAEKNPFAKLFDDFQKLSKGAKFDKAMFADVGAALQGVNGIVDSARNGLDTLGVKLDEQDNKVLDDIQGMISGGATLAMGIASGNPIQMIQGSIELITNGIDLIWGANDRKVLKAIAANEEAVKRLENAYDDLKQSVDDAYGDDHFRQQAKLLDNLQKQLELEKQNIQYQKSREGKKYDKDAVDAAVQAAKDTQNALDDILDEMSERIMQITGKDFAATLGDSIFDAIASSGDAFDIINEKSDEAIQNIVKQWLKTKLLEAPLQEMLKSLQSKILVNSGNLWSEKDLNTPEAKAAFDEFKNGVQGIGQAYADVLKGMDWLFDADIEQNARTGSVKGVTEETAGYVVGQMTGVRLSQDRQETVLGQTLKIEQSQLDVLNKIYDNGVNMKDLVEGILNTLEANSNNNSLRAKGF